MTNSLVLQPKRVSRSTVWRILVYSEAIGEERGKEEEERACWERSKLPPAPLGESRHSHLYFCFQKPPHWSPASCLNPAVDLSQEVGTGMFYRLKSCHFHPLLRTCLWLPVHSG